MPASKGQPTNANPIPNPTPPAPSPPPLAKNIAAKGANPGHPAPSSSGLYPCAPGRSRERILVYGPGGVGKTNGALSIARGLSKSPATFYIIDNDNAYDRLLETDYTDLLVREDYFSGKRDTQFEAPNGTLIIYRCNGWAENQWALEQAFERAGKDDWIIIDKMTLLWSGIQAWYVKQAYGMAVDDWFMAAKAKQVEKNDGKKHTAVEELFHDWGFINPVYTENVRNRVLNARCHLYMTADMSGLSGQEDDETKKLYAAVGAKPDGQKKVGHDSHGVFVLGRDGRFGGEKWVLTTVKERGRQRLTGWEYGDMFEGYLKTIGGWR